MKRGFFTWYFWCGCCSFTLWDEQTGWPFSHSAVGSLLSTARVHGKPFVLADSWITMKKQYSARLQSESQSVGFWKSNLSQDRPEPVIFMYNRNRTNVRYSWGAKHNAWQQRNNIILNIFIYSCIYKWDWSYIQFQCYSSIAALKAVNEKWQAVILTPWLGETREGWANSSPGSISMYIALSRSCRKALEQQ